MKIVSFFIAMVSMFLFSCEQEIEVDIPETPPKIVINAMLESYTLPNATRLGLELHGSRHIFDSTSNTLITNAVVLLYRDSIFMDTLKYDEETQFYPLGFSPLDGPKAGESYQIAVSAPGYTSVYAQTTIPQKVEIEAIAIDRIGFEDEDGGIYSKITVTYNDPIDKNNYYEVVLSTFGAEHSPGDYRRLTTYEPYIVSEIHYPPITNVDLRRPKYLLFNDKSLNGNKVELSFYYYADQSIDVGGRILGNVQITVQLRNVTKEYYDFRSSFLYNTFNQVENMIYGTGEPMNVYSNVENGYGIFAGYNNSIVTLQLNKLIVE